MYFTTLTLAALAALSTALPTTISERGLNIVHPYQIYAYNNTQIRPTTKGEVSRKFPAGTEVSTLVTFNINLKPATPLPTTCLLRFSVGPGTKSSPTSKNTIAVFSSLGPAPEPVPGQDVISGGNRRNLELGRLAIDLHAKGDARVKVVDSRPALSEGFPCPKAGDMNVVTDRRDGYDALFFGYEIVFVGQEGKLEWDGGANGLYLTYQW